MPDKSKVQNSNFQYRIYSKDTVFAWAYYRKTHINSYHPMQNFILNPNMWLKKYNAHAF